MHTIHSPLRAPRTVFRDLAPHPSGRRLDVRCQAGDVAVLPSISRIQRPSLARPTECQFQSSAGLSRTPHADGDLRGCANADRARVGQDRRSDVVLSLNRPESLQFAHFSALVSAGRCQSHRRPGLSSPESIGSQYPQRPYNTPSEPTIPLAKALALISYTNLSTLVTLFSLYTMSTRAQDLPNFAKTVYVCHPSIRCSRCLNCTRALAKAPRSSAPS